MWRYSCCPSLMRALAPVPSSARGLHSSSSARGAATAIARSVQPSHTSAVTARPVSCSSRAAPWASRHFSSTVEGSSAGAAAAAAASAATASPSAAAAASRPGGWLCAVPNESVIRISASPTATSPAELLKYLHNLATLDIYGLVGVQHSEGHAHFLSAKGRVQFEGMFAPIDAASAEWMAAGAMKGTHAMRGPAGLSRMGMLPATSIPPSLAVKSDRPRGFYLILPAAAAPLALAHLRQYNLRRKAVIEDVSALVDVHQAVPFRVLEEQRGTVAALPLPPKADSGASAHRDEVAQLLGLESGEQVARLGLHAMVDPRCRSMGVRILSPKGQTPSLPDSFTTVSAPSFYDAYRVLQGICSTPHEIVSDKSLPLEQSLVEAGGVSFEKGCYLGQELTARTHFQGVVRKRVWPAYATKRAEDAVMRGKPLPQLLASVATASSGSQPPPTDADPFEQLKFYFPFFDPSIPTIPTDTPIVRAPAAPAAAVPAGGEGATAAPAVAAVKEVARVLSSQHNVFLAMLRSEHVEDETHTLQLQLQPQPHPDAPPAPAPAAGDALTVVPYQPVWWKRPAAAAAAADAVDADADADAKQTDGSGSAEAGRT